MSKKEPSGEQEPDGCYRLTDQAKAMITWGGVKALADADKREAFFAGFEAGRTHATIQSLMAPKGTQ